MKRFLLGLFLVATTVASAEANLGDNENKVSAAYGKRIETVPRIQGSESGTVTNVYSKGGITCMVLFREGVSVFETYARVNQADLSAKEIETFLKANAAGAKWVAVENKGAGREWKRSDHKAKAGYARIGGQPTLTVMEATPGKK